MKSLKNLWPEFISDKNIISAVMAVGKSNSSKSLKKRAVAKRWAAEAESHVEEIRAYAENFHNARHYPRKIVEHGKERTILPPTLLEEYVHHMLIQCMAPIFKGIYDHSYCSVPGRGVHGAVERIYRAAQEPQNRLCAQMDIRHFFDTIPHDRLKARLDKVIHDYRFKSVLYEVIGATDEGLPLGFYVSPWLANWYLAPLDRYITEELKVGGFTRYNDDMVIVGRNKRRLHDARRKIEIFLSDELGLEMKDNWQVYRIAYPVRNKDGSFKLDKNGKQVYKGRPIDIVGFLVYKDKLILRKKNMLKATRKARAMSKKDKVTVFDCRQIITYLSNFKRTDTYNCFKTYISPYVTVKRLKQRISAYDRRRNNESNIQNSRIDK